MQFLDTVALSGVAERDDGFLVADAYTARTGIQYYAGHEVDSPLPRVAVYRDAAEVFAHASLRSFAHAPLTLDHPAEPVTAENWKDLAVGEAASEVLRDGERLRIPLIVKAKDAIDAIRSGKRELSVGYSCDLHFVDGVAPDGTPYQAVQKNIRANHIAIVDRGRAGPEFRFGDSWGVAPMTEDDMTTATPATLRPITLDGITIQTTEQGAQAIEKLQRQVAQLVTDNLTLTANVGARDGEIGGLKIEVQKLKDAAPDARALDLLAAGRAALLEQARTIAPDLKMDGLSDSDIRRAAVAVAFGDAIVKDVSDAEVAGMFKTATIARRDPVAEAMRTGSRQPPASTADASPPSLVSRMMPTSDSQLEYEQRMRDAYKTKAA